MRIGEVSEYSGVSRRMLRYYDAAGIVSPSQRDPNGYRNYSDEDLARLVTLETLREIGLSLESAAELLARPHTLSTVMDQAIAGLRQRLADDQRLLNYLQPLSGAGRQGVADLMALLQRLRGLRGGGDIGAALTIPRSVAVVPMLEESDINLSGALLWNLQETNEALDVIADALNSSDPQRRKNAVQALGRFTSARSKQLLLFATGDEDSAVRRLATFALARRGELAMIPVLIAHIRSGDNDVEAGELLGALGNSATPVLMEHLLLGQSLPQQQRSRLVQALGDIPGSDELLTKLRADNDHQIAAIAASVVASAQRRKRPTAKRAKAKRVTPTPQG